MGAIRTKAGAFLLASIVALWVPTTAWSYPVTLSLQNFVFNDGATASGVIFLTTNGGLKASNITTTTGTSKLPGASQLLAGSLYVDPGNPSSTYVNSVFMTFAGTYAISVILDLAKPFSGSMTGDDPITGGCETHSFQLTCAAALTVAPTMTRTLVLTDDPELVVPEPATLVLLAGGLLGLGAARRRRNTEVSR